jgi:type I restriction enzyme S subunit
VSRATVPLEDIVTISGGGTPSTKRPEYFEGRIPWVSPKDMKCWDIVDSMDHVTEEAIASSTTTLIAPNAVLVVVRSGVLKHTLPIAINRVPVALNQDMKALICGDRVIPDYLARALQALSSKLLQTVRGTTADNIPTDVMRALEIPLPKLREQRLIAGRLDQADRLCRIHRHALELIDTIVPAAFLRFFGNSSFARVALEELASDERNSFVNGPFGSDLLTSELTESGVPVVYIRDISSGRYERTRSVFVSPEKAADLEFCNAKPGDVLVAKVGDPPGIAAVYPEGEVEGIVTQDVIRIRPKTESVSAHYLQAFLNSRLARTETSKIMVEGTRLRFSLGQFKEILVPLPPLLLQKKFAAQVERVECLRGSKREALRQSEHLFASLLYRAFSG